MPAKAPAATALISPSLTSSFIPALALFHLLQVTMSTATLAAANLMTTAMVHVTAGGLGQRAVPGLIHTLHADAGQQPWSNRYCNIEAPIASC